MNEIEINRLNKEAWNLRLLDLQASYRSANDLLEFSESLDFSQGIADCCKTLGYCYWRFSDFSLSLSHSMRALDLYKQIGDKQGESDALNSVGAVYMFQNNHEKRLEVNIRCKQLRLEIGDLEGAASSEGNIGETYFEMGDFKNAIKCFEKCLDNKNTPKEDMAWAYFNLGRVENSKNNYDKALEYYTKSLKLSESINYAVLIVDSSLSITALFLNQQNYSGALINTKKSLDVSREIGAKEGEKKSLYYLSKIYENQGLFKKSLKYHKDYHTLELEISRDTEIERLKTMQLKVAYDKIEDQKNELVDSIRYAQRIQQALLTRDQEHKLLSNYFVLFEPKNIVSGDFYWYYEEGDCFYVAVADCTGHGVPGALLTMLGTTFLNEIMTSGNGLAPATILDKLRLKIIKALSQKNEESGAKDGMDISLIRINVKTHKAEWAGAYNPLWIIRKETKLESTSVYRTRTNDLHTLFEIKADKFPIGILDNMKPFTNQKISLCVGDSIYLFSDGFSDQFGGPKGKKYRTGNFKDTLLNIEKIEIEKRGSVLKKTFSDWKESVEQIDDVCVFGFNLSPPRKE